jgi:hypothetical protein
VGLDDASVAEVNREGERERGGTGQGVKSPRPASSWLTPIVRGRGPMGGGGGFLVSSVSTEADSEPDCAKPDFGLYAIYYYFLFVFCINH